MTELNEKREIKVNSVDSTESNADISESPKKEKKKNAIQLKSYRPLSIFGNFNHIFDEIDQYFNDFWKPSRLWNFEPLKLSVLDDEKFFQMPLTNIIDEGDHYSITAQLPGLDKGDIEITIHDGILEIKGEQKEEYGDKKEGYVRKEYYSSSYYRQFTVPENIDEEKIDAKLDKGILTLNLPKRELENKEKKKIEIQ